MVNPTIEGAMIVLGAILSAISLVLTAGDAHSLLTPRAKNSSSFFPNVSQLWKSFKGSKKNLF